METATLEIKGLSLETLSALDEKAQAFGKSLEEYAREVIEDEAAASEPDSDVLLAPFRQQVAESGISDEELDELFMEARREYYHEQLITR